MLSTNNMKLSVPELGNVLNCIAPVVQNTEKEVRSRTKTKKNEDLDIERIISVINNKIHKKIITLDDGKKVIRAYRSSGSGNRKIHYDFCVDIENLDGSQQTGLRVEHKGSVEKRTIDPDHRLGVQFHNGSPKLSIMMVYLSAWYHFWLASGRLSEKYRITSTVPTFEDWVKRDAMVQGDPKTPFGKELKQLAREQNGPGSSLTAERDEFMNDGGFSAEMVTTEHLEELKTHVLETANHCLQEKDMWLQIAGNIHGEETDYNHIWTPKSPLIESISSVTIKMESKKNVEFVLDACYKGLDEKPIKIVGIMRWGKGQGFSNFRFDLK